MGDGGLCGKMRGVCRKTKKGVFLRKKLFFFTE